VTIDLDMPQIQPEMLVKVENLANQIIFENRPVMANIVSPEEFAKSGARARKLPEHLATDGLRVIEIEGLDATACGGTHVARTGEIGIIKILRTERNGQETRVEFRCGQRALEDYRLKNTITHQLAAEFTVGIWEIDQAVARLKAEVKQAHSTCREMQEQLLEYEADQLLASARIHGKVRAIRAVFEDRDAANLRSLASRLKEEAYTIALLGVAGEKSQIILARSTELHYDMSKVLKQVLATLGTDRGGGRPEFAQGGGVAASTEQIEAALQDAESSILAEI
jgi:alanyl-tRNA synthetase